MREDPKEGRKKRRKDPSARTGLYECKISKAKHETKIDGIKRRRKRFEAKGT